MLRSRAVEISAADGSRPSTIRRPPDRIHRARARRVEIALMCMTNLWIRCRWTLELRSFVAVRRRPGRRYGQSPISVPLDRLTSAHAQSGSESGHAGGADFLAGAVLRRKARARPLVPVVALRDATRALFAGRALCV